MHELTRHDDVLRVRLWSRVGAVVGYDVSCYLVRGTLVDTGHPMAARDVGDLVRERGVAGAVVTHWHEDHAGNVAPLARRGLPMDVLPETQAILRARPWIRLYRRVVWGRPARLERDVVPYVAQGVATVITPGHAPDHRVVWDAGTRTLFAGDLYLGVRSRVMHEEEDPRQLVASLRRVIALEPARLFCAHRGPVPDPVAALTAKAEFLEDRIGAVARRIDEGWSDGAILRAELEGEVREAAFSFGEYARRNFVKAVRRGGNGGAGLGEGGTEP